MSKARPKPKPRTPKPLSSRSKRGGNKPTGESSPPCAGADGPDTDTVDDRTWTAGDFTLVSSDGVWFRVDAVHLLSASSAFRAAYDPSVRTLRLTDACETAVVVKNFLDFAVKFRTSALIAQHRRARAARALSPWVALAAFLNKHGCATELRRLLYVFTREAGDGAESTAERFAIAALAGDVGACCDAIERAGGDTLVPALVCEDFRLLIPAQYWTALGKGWERSGKHRNRAEWARHFELLMDGTGR